MRTLAEWLEFQESVHPKTIDMGLERVAAVAHTLDVDRPAYRVIIVGGTNGKGSTCAHLEALFRAVGAPVGLFTSPHLIRYNERIRVNGAEVSDEELVAAFEKIDAARGEHTLTFFEYNTLAALWIFQQRQVEVAILEVGLGGRLDATNLINADVAVLTSVGLDHRDYLGDTLEAIGTEKAGIFRAGHEVVLGTDDMPASVLVAIESIGAGSIVAGKDFSWEIHEDSGEGETWSYHGLKWSFNDLPPSALAGDIQFRNASAALAAAEALNAPYVFDKHIVGEALRTVQLAGRFQVIPGDVEWILDIAHNEPAARVFAAHVRSRSEQGRTFAVTGILRDKDAAGIGHALSPLVDHWILCTLEGARGRPAAELAEALALPPNTRVTLADSVEQGCLRAKNFARAGDRVLIFGSTYVVGPALQWLQI